MTAGMIAGDGSSSQAQVGAAPGLRAANPLQWRGVAPGATIRSYSYTDGGDSITNYINDVTDAASNDGVVIANNSWGDSGCNPFPTDRTRVAHRFSTASSMAISGGE